MQKNEKCNRKIPDMSERNSFKSAEEYFDAQPNDIKKALIELKKCILKAAPNATELINYNIPAYSLVENGKREHQVMIAGSKKHIGFYPHPTTMEKFELELSEFKKGKGSVQFPLNTLLPKELIVRMVKYRKGLLNKNIEH